LANYVDAKEAEILVNKTFFPAIESVFGPEAQNFTDRWAVIFCFINENGRWPKASKMFE
jgi:hypothetical protein